jgi:hypothetical protein
VRTDHAPAVAPIRVRDYAISEELFSRGYERDGGPCRCTSLCCHHGVFADVRERDRVLQHRALVRKYMDATQDPDENKWFEGEEHDDSDFPSGRCVGTAVVNGKCAFLDGAGRCTLQRAATEEGMDRWTLKPLFCVLYPIEISDGVVGFDPMLQDEAPCCSVSPSFEIPLFEACRDELTHLLGQDGFRVLAEAYNRNRPESSGTS